MLTNNNLYLDVNNLKERIKKSGITQTNIAKRLKISKEHLNYMLNGKRELRDEYKEEILIILRKIG